MLTDNPLPLPTPMRFVLCLSLLLSGFLTLPTTASAQDQPNFVLIMCDDLGWGDVGFNGGTTIQTPHLDEMAAQSLKLNRFYAAAPVCSPTRGSVVTGRHPYRYGIYFANTGHLKPEEYTIYEALQSQGYATGHFGKWHMGTLTTKLQDSNRGKPGDDKHYSAPWHHAVETTRVTESKTPTYDPMIYPKNRGSKKNGWFPVQEDEESLIYGTHYFTGEDKIIAIDSPELKGDDSKIIVDAAVPFMEAAVADEKPFFAIVWFHAPHLPVVAGKEHTDLYLGTSEYEANYYGCVTALDEQVGRIRAKLRELGVAKNTMVAFCSDNGPEGSAGKAPGTAAEFRGRKRSLYEGGVRVPGLIEWPAKIQPGSVTDFPASTVDYFPTIVNAVGAELPDPDRPIDGIDLAPLFAGEMKERPAPLGFQSAKQLALSDNRYKIYSGNQGKKWELYDLLEDPSETTDLAEQKPEVLKAMVATFEEWQASCKVSDQGGDY